MKKKEIDQYSFVVRPLTAEEGSGFLCEFPDVPGCLGDGETPEEAIRDGRLALTAALKTLSDLGRDSPNPTKGSGQWRMRAPRSLHRRLALRAKAEGVSLNTFAVSLLAEGLGVRGAKKGKRVRA